MMSFASRRIIASTRGLRRSLASFNGNTRSFPAYRVFGESTLFNMKPIMPTFKQAGNQGAFTVQREGKLLLELTPRVNGQFLWDSNQNFALSVEELALIQHQLPAGHPVELSRRMDVDGYGGGGGGGGFGGGGAQGPQPDKVLYVEPTDGASVTFSLDYINPETGVGMGEGMQKCKLMAGEFGVVQTLITWVTPHLLGWPVMIECNNVNALPHPGGGGGGHGDVPF